MDATDQSNTYMSPFQATQQYKIFVKIKVFFFKTHQPFQQYLRFDIQFNVNTNNVAPDKTFELNYCRVFIKLGI